MDTALRPMSTSQVLDRTFYLYRNNFLLFVGIAIVGPILTLIAALLQLLIFGPPVMPPQMQPGNVDPAALQSFFQSFLLRTIVGAVIGFIVYAIGQALASGATIHAVSMVHLGKATTIQESYKAIQPIFWRILRIMMTIFAIGFWPVILSYVLIIAIALSMPSLMQGGGGAQLGFAIFVLVILVLSFVGIFGGIIWGFYVFCRYSLAVPACTLENLPAKYSLIRSKFLTKGSIGRVLAIYLLTLLIAWVMTSVLQTPAYIISNPFAMKPGPMSGAFLFWAFLGEFLGRTFASPIATIAIALIYYDERVRKEAFDLQLMMQALGQPSPAQAAAPASPA